MRTKRSTESKKKTARATKVRAVKAASTKTWVAGIDGLSLGITGAAIVAAGILVTAYKPAHPAATTPASISIDNASKLASADPRSATVANGTTSEGPAATATWPEPLTITGCLDRDGDEFRLTNAAGMGVPKARSWKSGFLKKNASAITVVDGNRRSRLQDHLGQRVSVTGMLVNRELQVGSMRPLSESCSEKTKI